MNSLEIINQYEKLLKELGYPKYTRTLATILYYLKLDDDIDLKSLLESIRDEIDFSLTKSEIGKQFTKLVRDRTSNNYVEHKVSGLTERDYLLMEKEQLESLIESLERELEHNDDDELKAKLKEYTRELEKIKAKLREIEKKEEIKMIKREIREKSKREKHKTTDKSREVKREIRTTTTSTSTKDIDNLMREIYDIRKQIDRLFYEISKLEREKESHITTTRDREILDEIRSIKREFFNIYKTISLLDEKIESIRSERVERELRRSRKRENGI
ncbi:MAG: hypothetical protein DRJ03_26690 [Chloroflexi bacterium]|nr:MAG: hypothetical protein DRJ03_26690 [Chloroflexota bacterium]